MVDPSNITNYNLDRNDLEIHLLFWLLVSGKNAKTTAKCLDSLIKLINNWHNQIYGEKEFSPFQMIRNMHDFYLGRRKTPTFRRNVCSVSEGVSVAND